MGRQQRGHLERLDRLRPIALDWFDADAWSQSIASKADPFVMPGLDPGIHPADCEMDGRAVAPPKAMARRRVKPGHDMAG